MAAQCAIVSIQGKHGTVNVVGHDFPGSLYVRSPRSPRTLCQIFLPYCLTQFTSYALNADMNMSKCERTTQLAVAG